MKSHHHATSQIVSYELEASIFSWEIAWILDDRPGQWMYHCHILEHHAAGMMAHFEIVNLDRPSEAAYESAHSCKH